MCFHLADSEFRSKQDGCLSSDQNLLSKNVLKPKLSQTKKEKTCLAFLARLICLANSLKSLFRLLPAQNAAQKQIRKKRIREQRSGTSIWSIQPKECRQASVSFNERRWHHWNSQPLSGVKWCIASSAMENNERKTRQFSQEKLEQASALWNVLQKQRILNSGYASPYLVLAKP